MPVVSVNHRLRDGPELGVKPRNFVTSQPLLNIGPNPLVVISPNLGFKSSVAASKQLPRETVPGVSVNNFQSKRHKLGDRARGTTQSLLSFTPQPSLTISPNLGIQPLIDVYKQKKQKPVSQPIYNNSLEQWRNLKGKIVKVLFPTLSSTYVNY